MYNAIYITTVKYIDTKQQSNKHTLTHEHTYKHSLTHEHTYKHSLTTQQCPKYHSLSNSILVIIFFGLMCSSWFLKKNVSSFAVQPSLSDSDCRQESAHKGNHGSWKCEQSLLKQHSQQMQYTYTCVHTV